MYVYIINNSLRKATFTYVLEILLHPMYIYDFVSKFTNVSLSLYASYFTPAINLRLSNVLLNCISHLTII